MPIIIYASILYTDMNYNVGHCCRVVRQMCLSAAGATEPPVFLYA